MKKHLWIKNFYYNIYLISNKCPKFVSKFLFYFFSKVVPMREHQLNDSKKHLASVHPDVGSSSLYTNEIKKNPSYDLRIIIPVYNVERYLGECLKSIFNQKTHYKFCVIAINDGSTDSSGMILQEYRKYPNLKIINQENMGAAKARNAGLKEIDAKYIMFVDSDDMLCDSAIDVLLDCAESTQVDIVQGGYLLYQRNRLLCNSGVPNEICSPQSLTGFPWGKIYKAELWKKFHFPEKYLFEDTVNNLIVYNIAKTAYIIDKAVVIYRNNASGVTIMSRGSTKCIDTLWVTKRLIEDYKKLQLPITSEICAVFLNQFLFNFNRILTLNDRKIDYAAFLIYREIFESINVDMSIFPDKIKIAYDSLKNNNFKKFFYVEFF